MPRFALDRDHYRDRSGVNWTTLKGYKPQWQRGIADKRGEEKCTVHASVLSRRLALLSAPRNEGGQGRLSEHIFSQVPRKAFFAGLYPTTKKLENGQIYYRLIKISKILSKIRLIISFPFLMLQCERIGSKRLPLMLCPCRGSLLETVSQSAFIGHTGSHTQISSIL